LQVAEPPVPQQPATQQLDPHATGWGAGHVQLPAWQVFGTAQALPHAPQFALSVATGTHAREQHASPAAQVVPQLPQCCRSVWRSKQPSTPDGWQSVRFPLLHAHVPAGHEVFPGAVQLTPQVPQFWGSKRFVQAGWADTAVVHSTGSGG
jgi:hypothetical protein